QNVVEIGAETGDEKRLVETETETEPAETATDLAETDIGRTDIGRIP
ncbi:hypothetical protein A2U01_0035468, partial [Trifolium medium]|nr:hypothetical protein [Trifolium medium]